MLPLSIWSLQTAANQMQVWHQSHGVDLIVGINVSVRQFNQSNFVDTVENLLEQSHLSPRQLELELTENCFISNPEFAEQTMEKLSKLKVRFCLDNFGSGSSSLGYLQQFSFDTVKLSPKIADQIESNPRNQSFVQAITTLSQGYNFRVVAVGVETKEQAELLFSLNCKQVQGNFYSSPLPIKEITQILTTS